MRNILIFTTEEDASSGIVCEYITNNFNCNPIRVNQGEGLHFISYNSISGNIVFSVRDEIYSIFDIHSVWFRRSVSGFKISNSEQDAARELALLWNETNNFKQEVIDNLRSNRKDLFQFFLRKLMTETKTLGSPFIMGLNKLRALEVAKEVGLNTPRTWILTNKNDLINLLSNECDSVITKAIEEGLYYFSDEYSYIVLTSRLKKSDIGFLSDFFPPSLFQEEVEKAYEVRSFFIDSNLYSMAIFSQGNKKTQVDYRNYDSSKPNRYIPYILPFEIEEKITHLFKKIGLNCGSVDLIKDKDGKYVFLEINPVGQFGMVSKPCNYNLEFLVAQWLTNN